jgi:hypothetical protein
VGVKLVEMVYNSVHIVVSEGLVFDKTIDESGAQVWVSASPHGKFKVYVGVLLGKIHKLLRLQKLSNSGR